jgi:molybdopterin/thiamine biosynthesis adenylyltransferase
MLREDQVRRYARHILLPDVGGRGQERLLASRVAVEVGPGRAAEVAALAYLAAAGIGRLGLCGEPHGPLGADEVARGILYGAGDLGRPRIDAIRERIAALNPDVTVDEEAGGEPLEVDRPAADVTEALEIGGAAASRLLTRIATR